VPGRNPPRSSLPAALACWLVPALAGCAVRVPLERGARDLHAEGIRTLALEDAFTLVSPYDARRTAEVAGELRRSLVAVCAALEVELDGAVYVRMIPLDVEGFDLVLEEDSLTVSGPLELPTRHGLVGWAAGDGPPRFEFFVPRDRVHEREDGTSFTEQFHFDFTDTIRHELTHLAARRAGLGGATWFDEGLACQLAATTLADGELEPLPLPPALAFARQVHERFELSTLLDWEEHVDRVASGEEQAFLEGRALAQAFLRFLLERTPGPTLRARLDRIHELDRGTLLALEDDWHAWLSEPPLASRGARPARVVVRTRARPRGSLSGSRCSAGRGTRAGAGPACSAAGPSAGWPRGRR